MAAVAYLTDADVTFYPASVLLYNEDALLQEVGDGELEHS